jgi:exonuclease III
MNSCNCINIEGYTAGAQYCRVLHEKGGVIIYVHNNLKFTNIDLSRYCKEKDFEVCAIKLTVNTLNICIITIYRSPAGNFNYFLQKLDKVLQLIHTLDLYIVICGDINVNYLTENEHK